MLLEIRKLLVPYPAVVAHRRQHLETGAQRAQRDLEANLVVAGSGTAVGDGRRAALIGNGRQPRRLQTALGTDAQRVGIAPEHVAGDQVANDRVEVVLPRIDEHVLHGAEGVSALFELRRGRGIDAAGVDRRGDDLAAVGFLEPRHAERRIEAA